MGIKCAHPGDNCEHLVTMRERDRKVIEAVSCPVCQAAPGVPCSYQNRWGGRNEMGYPHQARVEAYNAPAE
jgi:hypothetical protein